jgi:ATP-dependent RNA helicase RhlE
MLFQDLNLCEPIQRALKTAGYTKPTPIQAQSIPLFLEGRDLMACAQTGTGKTAAFALPILQLLQEKELENRNKRPVRSLILAPTRELAIQIGESFDAYGWHLPLHHAVIFGGVSQNAQTQKLRAGVDILVATPGRLLDLMNQGYIDLSQIEFFVLDEADRMLDMGFIHDIKKVIKALPQKRQTLLFSATMPPNIVELSNKLLHKPASVQVDPVSSTAERVEQSVYHISKKKKRSLLLHLFREEGIPEALVFTRTKHGANRVARDLSQKGIEAEAIHGNKSQTARQKALKNFKERRTRVLVATDIAARGIDIDELSHVINFDLPNIPETYVHRIGRTGRAGSSGIALSFCDAEERTYLKDIQKLTGLRIPVVEEHPFAGEEEQVALPENQPVQNGSQARPQRQNGNRPRSRNRNRRKTFN